MGAAEEDCRYRYQPKLNRTRCKRARRRGGKRGQVLGQGRGHGMDCGPSDAAFHPWNPPPSPAQPLHTDAHTDAAHPESIPLLLNPRSCSPLILYRPLLLPLLLPLLSLFPLLLPLLPLLLPLLPSLLFPKTVYRLPLS